MTATPAWQLRYTATECSFPAWTDEAPARVAVVSNRSGSSQVWWHDLAEATWHQVTQDPIGIEAVHVAPDGRAVWWVDRTGDERGHWVAAPFGGEPTRLVDGVPDGWSMGISIVGDRVAIGLATDEDYRVYVVDGGRDARMIFGHEDPAGVGAEWPEGLGGLSSDSSLVCVRHSEGGDILHHALRVFDADSGTVVGDLVDAGNTLAPIAWSPDGTTLAIVSERGTFERPGLWDPRSGRRRDLTLPELPGAVLPVAWYPDGRCLLTRHEHEGSAQLLRIDVDTQAASVVADPSGDIDEAGLRPDGDVWLRTSDAAHPPVVVSVSGGPVLAEVGATAPLGSPLPSMWFDNPHGDRIHALVGVPDGEGPFPTVMSVHGGPEWNERDRFDPEPQAFIDAGYAVALVNYRGSTGYGVGFRKALLADPGFIETEDVVAGLDRLIADGVADPDRVYWSGWSWGGCLGCLNAGLNPRRWRAMFAGIPAGDFVAAHWASAPALQAWDRAIYGGSPDEVPDAYRRANPMTYADRVRAPVMIIAGEHDSRCPIEGITPWVEAVREAGGEVVVHRYPAGHHANDAHEQVRHMQMILDFFAEHGGPPAPR